MMLRVLILLAIVALAGCAGQVPKPNARVAVFGDSMMAWNGFSGRSIPHVLERMISEPVASFATSGARITYPRRGPGKAGLDVRMQYRHGPWDVIIVNGGANDFFFECSCAACEDMLGGMISRDAEHGNLVRHLKMLRQTGAEVVYVGYHRSRGLNGPAKGCKNELDTLDARIEALARKEQGIHFVSLQTVFPAGDPSYYAADMLHVSAKGSSMIAARLAPIIAELLQR